MKVIFLLKLKLRNDQEPGANQRLALETKLESIAIHIYIYIYYKEIIRLTECAALFQSSSTFVNHEYFTSISTFMSLEKR